jgi:hypothetical protein
MHERARPAAPAGGRLGPLARPGAWFVVLVVLGAGLRLFFAIATRGTTDADLWTQHARGVALHGLIEHYRVSPLFNHPPAISLVMAGLWQLAQSLGLEFRVLYRTLFALADLGNVWLLLRLLRAERWRYVAAGAYAVAPIALVIGGMHGNTDALIASLLLIACPLAASRRAVLAGAVLGACAWIKLPGLLAAPAIGFALPRWRDRVVCALVALGVGASTYAWAFASDAGIVKERVFGYAGYYLVTVGDPPTWIWGFKNWYIRLFGENWAPFHNNWGMRSHLYALGAIVCYAFLRRRATDARGIARSVAGTYAIFYALAETWTFQYTGWSMPFWMVAGLPYAVAANVFAGGYVYGLYAYVCEDWLLRPEWDFNGHRYWPPVLVFLRDAAHLTFAAAAAVWFTRALRGEWRARRPAAPRAPA